MLKDHGLGLLDADSQPSVKTKGLQYVQLALDQAQNSADSEHTPQVQSAGSDINLRQIRYTADKVNTYREALCNLIRPVLGTAAPPGCLATALQSCIQEAALATFGRPSNAIVQKLIRNGMMQTVGLHVQD